MREHRILIPLFFLAIGALGCGLFSSKGGDAEMVFAATEVGTPEGDMVTKDIGPAGGTLASPDGRLTLTVPQGALTETLPFSIQPITNKAGNGLGLAYRLGPSGKTFTTPLQISVRYDEKDLEGTVPDVLALAYQDQQGAWHEMKTLNLTEDTLTVATMHFSDWAFLAKMRLSPATATVGVGKTQYIALLGCAQPELTTGQRFGRWVFGEEPYGSSTEVCQFGEVQAIRLEWFVDIGTVDNDKRNPVLYTAPPRKPTPNIATVVFPYHVQSKWDLKDYRRGMFTSKITIVDRGYKATGATGDVAYSGTVCSLDTPFTITGTSPIVSYPFKFVPISPTGGTASFAAKVSVITMEGGGFYTIEGADTDKPRIALTMNSAGHTPIGSESGGGTVYIDLIPLETDECNQRQQ